MAPTAQETKRDGTAYALKITLRVLGFLLVFGVGLFANDFVGIRNWVGGHKTATEIHALEYQRLRRDVDFHMATTTKLLNKIADKLEVD